MSSTAVRAPQQHRSVLSALRVQGWFLKHQLRICVTQRNLQLWKQAEQASSVVAHATGRGWLSTELILHFVTSMSKSINWWLQGAARGETLAHSWKRLYFKDIKIQDELLCMFEVRSAVALRQAWGNHDAVVRCAIRPIELALQLIISDWTEVLPQVPNPCHPIATSISKLWKLRHQKYTFQW